MTTKKQIIERKNPLGDVFLSKAKKWQEETEKLRTILLECGLAEELKWRQPCYTFEEKNVAIIQGFREYCALLFFKGALLKDSRKVLVKPGEHTQAGRQIRFTEVKEITSKEPVLKAYIREAIELERAGLKVSLKKTTDYKLPEELQSKFKEAPALRTAFIALTPGRQRAYILHFSAAKQSTTRTSRIEKCIPQILKGKGLND